MTLPWTNHIFQRSGPASASTIDPYRSFDIFERMMLALLNVKGLHDCKKIDDEQLLNLMRLINAKDREHLTVAEAFINEKLGLSDH